MCAVRQRWRQELARLEGRGHGGGDYVVERRGFEDPMCGVKRVSVTLVRKEKKRRKKNLSLLACLRMQAMAAAGLVRIEG